MVYHYFLSLPPPSFLLPLPPPSPSSLHHTQRSETNIMFREYLRRLESHKRCQNLSMQSFLLLPMQRITRLPLLILAILNRTPLDHPDHELVEQTLRTVQKVCQGRKGLKSCYVEVWSCDCHVVFSLSW